MMGNRDQRESEALAKARRQAAQAQQEAASLREIVRKQRVRTEEPRPARVDDRPRHTGYHDSFEKDDALPSWESFEQPYKRK